jgi:uncharacterized integral membrane protein
MGFAYILVAILSAAVAVFALQNNTPMSVRFLGWTLPEVPLAGAILASLITGMVVTAIPLMISQWRWRRRARTLETKVDMLETALSARETALLNQRPVAPPPAPPRVQNA